MKHKKMFAIFGRFGALRCIFETKWQADDYLKYKFPDRGYKIKRIALDIKKETYFEIRDYYIKNK